MVFLSLDCICDPVWAAGALCIDRGYCVAGGWRSNPAWLGCCTEHKLMGPSERRPSAGEDSKHKGSTATAIGETQALEPDQLSFSTWCVRHDQSAGAMQAPSADTASSVSLLRHKTSLDAFVCRVAYNPKGWQALLLNLCCSQVNILLCSEKLDEDARRLSSKRKRFTGQGTAPWKLNRRSSAPFIFVCATQHQILNHGHALDKLSLFPLMLGAVRHQLRTEYHLRDRARCSQRTCTVQGRSPVCQAG